MFILAGLGVDDVVVDLVEAPVEVNEVVDGVCC